MIPPDAGHKTLLMSRFQSSMLRNAAAMAFLIEAIGFLRVAQPALESHLDSLHAK